jgi:NADH dehydrogenase FAD-containing subunit
MKRIVILGGGFGGLAATQYLDRTFRDDDEVEIVLVSSFTTLAAGFVGQPDLRY